ncbi:MULTISPECIES: PilX N-terminal domain-containing pilus assembly protein [Rhodanobacteraceae]|uniref:pilus assembly PilX family protein n=1 Tax=Rhodanobacteraceae TaxID=1775411 RepID=UPI00088E694F|nr:MULTISPECIES: PilX N-terminal domain-containing pilus assembly protein [Rhodanobacteraceae]SDF14830.1 Tfp pilus assembly protein PilX [Dyella sp. 333MFSha]SKB82821.1 Tfp pilus assembly protein PilX [Luteibacter sp. 22Crub2.1]
MSIRSPGSQRGIALFVGMVFLVVLSIVAVVAMRGTLVEMRMVTNTARHETAFEASEALRSVPVSLFDEHVYARGWPASFNGDVPDSEFTYSTDIPASLLAEAKSALQTDCSTNKPSLFYGQLQPACGDQPKETLYNPATWRPDMIIAICDTGTKSCSGDVKASVAIVPDGTTLGEGAGGAQAAGYRGLGIGAANGGAEMYFEVRSIATAPGDGAATTHTQYHQMIH